MAVSIASVSCKRFTYEDFRNNKLKPEDFFGFSSFSSIKLDIDYGPLGAKAPVSVFVNEPKFKDNVLLPDVKADYSVYADENGRIKAAANLPSYGDTLFIVTERLGLPTVLKCGVKDGVVSVRTGDLAASAQIAATKADKDLQVFDIKDNYYSIVKWTGDYGKIIDANGLVSEGNLTADKIRSIQQTIWGGSHRPSGIDNSNYTTELDNNNVVVRQDSEVFLTFVSESSEKMNTLCYYVYQNKLPGKPDKIKKYIVIPNASSAGNAPFAGNYGGSKFSPESAPIAANTKIQLLYVDDAGNVSKTFPAGSKIGFQTIDNSYICYHKKDYNRSYVWWRGYNFESLDKYNTIGAINSNYPTVLLHTDNKLNNGGVKRSCYISFQMKDGTLVFGLEEDGWDKNGWDKSYDDLIFTIESSVPGSIDDPERPNPDPEVPEDETLDTYYLTYAFEDLWSYRGDYDMNDVVMEHKLLVDFGEDNYVKEIKDVFRVANRQYSATFPDGFAVRIPYGQKGEMTIPQGAFDETVGEDATGCVLLFENAQEVLGEEFVITRRFSPGELRRELVSLDYDPFIIVSGDDRVPWTEKGRYEVHMPKKVGTMKHNYYFYGMGDEAYYVDKDGKHPFAITVPLPAFPTVGYPEYYHIVTEMVAIEKEYEFFEPWCESWGEEHTDWYLHYKSTAN